jgi:hypothetical protein
MSATHAGRLSRPMAVGALIVVAAVVAVGGIVFSNRPDNPDPPTQAGATVVSPKGGTFDLGAFTVTAPAGAVAVETTITAGPTTQLTREAAGPLAGRRTHGVQFDLALAGNLQPAQPLKVSIPLSGSMLPPGADPTAALLYTPDQQRPGGFRLVPATLLPAANGQPATLVAQLVHLSPKWLVFPSFTDVMDRLLKPAGAKAGECPDPKRTDVRLSPDKSWSLKDTSPLHPCLTGTGRSLTLTVANNADYMWSIRPARNLKVTSVADDEAEAVKYLTDLLFSNAQGTGITGYLAKGSMATAQFDTADLPATVKFEASPNTFLAQSVWISANFIADLVVGSTSDTVEAVGIVLKSVDFIDCAKKAVTVDDAVEHIDRVMDFMVSTCGQIVAQILTDASVTNIVSWRILWDRLFTLAIGFRDAINNAGTAITGAYRSARGLITVTVAAGAPDCLKRTQLFRITVPGVSLAELDASPIVCQAGWATAAVWSLPASEDTEAAHYVLRQQNGSWRVVEFGVGTWILNDKPICRQLPVKVRAEVCPN